MHFEEFGNTFVVRLDPGEEILTELKQFCKDQGIRLGSFTAIGAVNRAKIGLYELSIKQYHEKEFTGDFEIAPLVGNITTMDGEVYLHAHITIAGSDHVAYAGHLTEAIVSATCEIFIHAYDGELSRKKNEDIGLNLIQF